MRADQMSWNKIDEARRNRKIEALSPNEEQFLETVRWLLDEDRPLSRKQRQWLGRIQEKVYKW